MMMLLVISAVVADSHGGGYEKPQWCNTDYDCDYKNHYKCNTYSYKCYYKPPKPEYYKPEPKPYYKPEPKPYYKPETPKPYY